MDSNFINSEAEEVLPVDHILQSLADRQRREILSLLDQKPEWTRPELIDRLVQLRGERAESGISELEAVLVHNHLPRLEQAELVTLDADTWMIRRGENFDVIRDMVDAAASVRVDR